mgnify:CR=1 FL=1
MDEITATQRQLDQISDTIATLQKGAALKGDELLSLVHVVQQLSKCVNGDPGSDTIGLRQRVKVLEMAVDILQEDKKQTASTLKGIAIGLGLTGLTGAGTFVTMLIQLLGGK